MIKQILPLEVRSSSSRKTDVLAVSSARSASLQNATTATRSHDHLMVYRKPNFGDVAASRGNAKVPFDLLSGTFWDSSWADSTDGKNLPKAGRLVTAVKKKASARLDQLRYGLLVLAWGGACGVLTVLLLTIVSQTAKQSHGFNSPAILIAAIQDHSRQASNR